MEQFTLAPITFTHLMAKAAQNFGKNVLVPILLLLGRMVLTHQIQPEDSFS